MAVALRLTDDQKAALKMCWARVEVSKAALTEQHSKLSARLQELLQQQKRRQQQFAAEALQLPVPQLVQRLGKAPEAQQQPQQRQLLPVIDTNSQGLAGPGSLQMQQLEEELQEVERMLFAGLEDTDAAAASTPSGSWPAWLGSYVLQGEQRQLLLSVLAGTEDVSGMASAAAAAGMPCTDVFGMLACPAGSSGKSDAALKADAASEWTYDGSLQGRNRWRDSDNSAAGRAAEELQPVSCCCIVKPSQTSSTCRIAVCPKNSNCTRHCPEAITSPCACFLVPPQVAVHL
jgi:hypothetical protein